MNRFTGSPTPQARDTVRLALETIVPVPAIVQQRGWEAAFMVGAEHSAELRDRLGADAGDAVWHWAQPRYLAGPDAMTWADCRIAFWSHRLAFGARA
jgi:hypothetical protein